MQQALEQLVEDLDPKAIEDSLGKEQGLAAVLGSRKGPALEGVRATLEGQNQRGAGAACTNVFMQYFAECYDRDTARSHVICARSFDRSRFSRSEARKAAMSWYSKVAWLEGLFLRPQHLQQTDRYLEHLVEARVRHATPYPWGFSHLEIDLDLAQQSKFALRRAAGVMPDGTPFDVPGDSPLPAADRRARQSAAKQIAWLSLPVQAPNTREVDSASAESASRFTVGSETFIDSTASLRLEQEIDVAYPRLSFDLRKQAEGRLRQPCDRRDHRGQRQEDHLRPEIRAAAADLLGPSAWSRAGSTASSAGSRTSSRNWPATRPTRPPAAGCRASTISSCSCSTGTSRCCATCAASNLRPPRAALPGAAAARGRTRDLRDPGAAGPRPTRPTTTTGSSRPSSR